MILLLYKRFFHSLRWNAVESLAYQSVLLVHQLLLFKATSLATYGLIGTTFSLIYCCITVLNMGFDAAVSPLFSLFTTGKRHFLHLFYAQIVCQAALFACTIPVALCVKYLFNQSLWLLPHLSLPLIVAIGLAIIFEGIKKNLKMFLQVAFMSKKVAILEIATIILYVVLVWSWYALTQEVTIATIIMPLVVISIIDTAVLSYYVYQSYKHLPEDTQTSLHIHWHRIAHVRLSNWLHQLSNLLYSSNFLVPFFSMTLGLTHAGIFKLIGSITYFITTIIHRMFGNASAAILAHTKQYSLSEKQVTFSTMTNTFNQVLYGLFIFAAINYRKILTINGIEATHMNWAIAYLFFFMNLIENFLIAYEKFIAVEEKAFYLIATNLSSIVLLSLIMWQAPHMSLLTILISFTAVRIFMLMIIGIIAWHTWSIKPSYRPHLKTLISFFIFSSIFFLLLHV